MNVPSLQPGMADTLPTTRNTNVNTNVEAAARQVIGNARSSGKCCLPKCCIGIPIGLAMVITALALFFLKLTPSWVPYTLGAVGGLVLGLTTCSSGKAKEPQGLLSTREQLKPV